MTCANPALASQRTYVIVQLGNQLCLFSLDGARCVAPVRERDGRAGSYGTRSGCTARTSSTLGAAG